MKHTISIALTAVLVCLSVIGCKKETIATAPSYQIKMDNDSVFVGDTVTFYIDVLERGSYYGNGKFDWAISGVETAYATIEVTDPYGAAPKSMQYSYKIGKAGNHTVSMSGTIRFYAPSASGSLYGSITAKSLSFVAYQRNH